MTKGIPYEALMSLSIEQITEAFPHGARKVGKERYSPADTPENASKPLEKLLKDKKSRQEKPRYLKQSYSRDNYTHVPTQAMGVDKNGRGAPEEAVPRDVQIGISEEARMRHSSTKAEEDRTALLGEQDALRAQLSAHQALAKEKGADIRADVRIVEKRLEVIGRKLGIGEEAA